MPPRPRRRRVEADRATPGHSADTIYALLVDLKTDLRTMRQEHGDALGDMRQEHGAALGDIRKETRDTNGKVAEALTRIAGHDREIGAVKKDVRDLQSTPHAPAPIAVVNEPGESFQVSGKVTPKMWALIASIITALLAFGPAINRWLERLLEKVGNQ